MMVILTGVRWYVTVVFVCTKTLILIKFSFYQVLFSLMLRAVGILSKKSLYTQSDEDHFQSFLLEALWFKLLH